MKNQKKKNNSNDLPRSAPSTFSTRGTAQALASENGHILTVRALRSQQAVLRADDAVKRATRLKNATKHGLLIKSGSLYAFPGRRAGRNGQFVGNC